MIDTHSHIYLNQFDEDREEAIFRAKKAGISKIILPNIDKESLPDLLKCSETFSDYCIALNGLHPTSVNANYKSELSFLLESFDTHTFYGVGEIGIDLYWDKTFLKEQTEAFETQVDFAIQNNMPIVIHARDSFNEIFNSLKRFKNQNLNGVFHSFSGDENDVIEIEKLGNFYFGINGIVTFKNSRLKDVLKQIGINRLLLETDSPYLAPVPFRGKRNESSYLSYICEFIAQYINIDTDALDAETTKNANTLFNLD